MPPRAAANYNPLLKSFPDSVKINSVSEGAEILYLRLIAACDDLGRYYADPMIVLAKLFSFRLASGTVSERAVTDRIDELKRVDLIRIYEVGEARYLEMVNIKKATRTDVKIKQHFPEPTYELKPWCESELQESVTKSERDVTNTERSVTKSDPKPNQIEPNRTEPNQDYSAADADAVSSEGGYTATFESWYEHYPKKKAKREAFSAFQRACKRLASAGRDRSSVVQFLTDAVAAYAGSEEGRGQYCPHPATWLNDGRYDDDRSEWGVRRSVAIGGGGSNTKPKISFSG